MGDSYVTPQVQQLERAKRAVRRRWLRLEEETLVGKDRAGDCLKALRVSPRSAVLIEACSGLY